VANTAATHTQHYFNGTNVTELRH